MAFEYAFISQGDMGFSTLVVIRIIDFMIDMAFEDETEFSLGFLDTVYKLDASLEVYYLFPCVADGN